MRAGMPMTDARQANQNEAERPSATHVGADAGSQLNHDAPRDQANPAGVELRQRLDQIGNILAKGLDLVEAGASLGVTIVSRIGVAAQQKIREGTDAAAGVAPAQPGTGPAAQVQTYSEAEPPATEAEPAFGITNRLPLTPGGTVRISFSVNNDSMTEPKKVELRVEGFTGDSQGTRLDASAFTVKPPRKVIAPVDFEKFILQGPVPADAPPDVYRGMVTVVSGNELKIPVVLVVMRP
jgi:hypothetical protein